MAKVKVYGPAQPPAAPAKPIGIVEFTSRTGRVALIADHVEAIAEADEGCSIVTRRDVHRVSASYDEAIAAIWPVRVTC